MAERAGFEPAKELPLYTLSKRAPSTTRPPLHQILAFETINISIVYSNTHNIMLKKIFNYYGYSFNKIKKSNTIIDIIKFRLKHNKCTTLLDIGANKGDFTGDLLDCFKKKILIEPNPNLINNLKDRFSNIKNLEISNCAIDIKNSVKKFYITNDTGATLSSSKKQTNTLKKNLKKTNIISTKKIQFYRLDFFLKNRFNSNDSIFLKSDTQGNDYEVLKSLGNKLKFIKYIKIEMSIIPMYSNQDHHWKILDFMKKNNFEPVFYENGLRNNFGKMIEYDCLFEKQN